MYCTQLSCLSYKVGSMKKYLKIIYAIYLRLFSSLLLLVLILVEMLPRGRRISTLFFERVWGRFHKVQTEKGPIYFCTPDWLSKFRANSFYEKEPETIKFIETFNTESVFWDVGANIGIYSIYASKLKNTRVYSFEPSLLNVELLFRNVQINDLGEKITIVPIALSNKTSVLDFFMSKNDLRWAGAHNSIGSNTSYTGGRMTDFITSSQVTCRGDDLLKIFNLPIPTHIKIDVDGLEGDVIEGLQTMLKEIKFVLIEVDESNKILNDRVKNMMERENFLRILEVGQVQYAGNQLWKNQVLKD
jgi:FkbM family methyltransferase